MCSQFLLQKQIGSRFSGSNRNVEVGIACKVREASTMCIFPPRYFKKCCCLIRHSARLHTSTDHKDWLRHQHWHGLFSLLWVVGSTYFVLGTIILALPSHPPPPSPPTLHPLPPPPPPYPCSRGGVPLKIGPEFFPKAPQSPPSPPPPPPTPPPPCHPPLHLLQTE